MSFAVSYKYISERWTTYPSYARLLPANTKPILESDLLDPIFINKLAEKKEYPRKGSPHVIK